MNSFGPSSKTTFISQTATYRIKSHLLYDTTTQKLSYITDEEATELRKRKILWRIEIPPFARKVDIQIGFSKERYAGSVWLPGMVVLGRLLGRWESLYAIEGWEDV
ncbi:uncharacterized protein LY89DRAFT_764016 [Mollisia scopiformis]|uniref:Uncharacterized protein n=1 Tax=Mollisia scopiformis TaxID=149040 RepID=A0A132B8E7_MOLSC|nr:uncharacterized protein LY89DRAFT_764016 [Mollisia scopiformis]KUJ08676.1 hypothetical protein LY89DRAFT_764016 [Mollisia scopiformis]